MKTRSKWVTKNIENGKKRNQDIRIWIEKETKEDNVTNVLEGIEKEEKAMRRKKKGREK